jgi:hypothetical protein
MAISAPKGRLPDKQWSHRGDLTAGADVMILRLQMTLCNMLRKGKIEGFDKSSASPGCARCGLSTACRRAGQVFFVSHPCIKGVANQYHRHAPRPLRYIALQNVNENAIFPPGVNSE